MRAKGASTSASPDVLVTEVRPEDVPIYDDFVGTLDGSVNASIQARVQGYLTSQNYKKGGAVKKGDLLFQIEPRPVKRHWRRRRPPLSRRKPPHIRRR